MSSADLFHGSLHLILPYSWFVSYVVYRFLLDSSSHSVFCGFIFLPEFVSYGLVYVVYVVVCFLACSEIF